MSTAKKDKKIIAKFSTVFILYILFNRIWVTPSVKIRKIYKNISYLGDFLLITKVA